MRPVSIVNFERCYLGAVAVGLLNSVLMFPAMLRAPQTAQAVAVMGPNGLGIMLGVGVLISLLLWYFAARRASVVAKWIIVVLFAFAVLGLLQSLGAGFPKGPSGVLRIVGFVLQAIAVVLLFHPDAKAWFTRGADGRSAFR